MILPAFLIIASLFVYIGNNGILKKFCLLWGIGIPVFFQTFRFVGTDTFTYIDIFNSDNGIPLIRLLNNSDWKEPLNTLFIYIGNQFNNYHVYFFLYGLLTTYIMYKALEFFLSDNPQLLSLSFFLYLMMFYPQSLNIMRQELALSIIVYAYRFIIQKNILKYMCSIFIAAGFHFSALIAMPIYFIINKNGNINKIFMSLISVALLLFTNKISVFFTSISEIEGFQRYDQYANFNGDINNRIFFLYLLIYIIIFAFINKVEINKVSKNLLYALLIIGLIAELTGFVSPFIKRIALYFDISQIILLPYIAQCFIRKSSKYIVNIFIIVGAIMYYIALFVVLKQVQIYPFIFNF